MSDREIVYAVRHTDGISGAVYQSRAEAESDVEAAASFGIDAAAVELVEVVRCADCRNWTRNPNRVDRGTCLHHGYTDDDWYCPNGSRR